jgi:DNA (cytosine-5)-methyltransferase 1
MAIRPVKKDKVTLLRQSGSDRPPELRLAFASRDPDTELVVDNFAGGGGASIGMEMGLDGRKVDVAINHDAEAIALHKANHPETEHHQEDVFTVEPMDVIRDPRTGKPRPVGLAWFSPDCKDFSKAKGGKPKSKRIRALAWVMVRWAELPPDVRPRVMWLENVEEFQGWGPLLANGFRCPFREGRTFRKFVARLRNLGGTVEWRELRACDYGGAPTIRKRLYLCCRFDGRPIVWPERTHGPADHPDVIAGKLQPYAIAADCIDWSIACPSIFLTNEEAKALGIKRPLVFATMRRIARGIFMFVINNKRPFIVRIAHGEESPSGVKRWGDGAHSVDEPLGTIPASNEFAVVSPHITKFRTGATGSGCDEPMPTVTAGPKENPAGAAHAMGVVQAQLAPFMQQSGHYKSHSDMVKRADEPLRTQSTHREHSVVTAKLAPIITEHANGTHPLSWRADEPLRTQCAQVKGGHFAIAAATLVQTGYGEREGQKPRVPGLDKPLGTVVGGGQKHALVSAFLAKHYGGNETPGASLDQPCDTITAKDHHAVVAGHLVRHFGESVGSDVAEPVPTITGGGGGKTALCATHISKLHGTSTAHGSDEPLHTISAGGNHYAQVCAFLTKYYGEGGQDQACDEPMHTISTRDRLGLVIVEGEPWLITDIGMRMLEPRELFNAQGFPRGYIIDIQVVDTWRSILRGETVYKKLPKHAQVRLCGNSVPPPTVALLVSHNVPELKRKEALAA